MQHIFCFTASDSWHGGSHGGNSPGPVGDPAGHFCCSAGDEFADAAAPSCGGALEDEASAADLAAGLRVSQPRSQPCPGSTAHAENASQGHPHYLWSSPEHWLCHSAAAKFLWKENFFVWFCGHELQFCTLCLPCSGWVVITALGSAPALSSSLAL